MSVINMMNEFNNPRVISGFGNTFICTSGVMDDKTVNFPQGYENDEYIAFKVVFKNGHQKYTDENMTLNNIPIVVSKDGELIPLPTHQMEVDEVTVYKSLQSNTTLEMYYTADYDGEGNPAFVIVGNPIVISSEDYIIYACGLVIQFIYYRYLYGRVTITLPNPMTTTEYAVIAQSSYRSGTSHRMCEINSREYNSFICTVGATDAGGYQEGWFDFLIMGY